MKEIGGYIELDTYKLPMLHEGAHELNCGRNAIAYLAEAENIKKILLPYFLCRSVPDLCEREGIEYSSYHINEDLLPPSDLSLGDGEWLYLVNYYGQLSNDIIAEYKAGYKRIIVDNAQSYFQMPVEGVDTIYTCRKYFGVTDGAFLYTNRTLDREIDMDESYSRMGFLLGRFERTGSEFYADYAANNKRFSAEPLKRMSRLTRNLLHGIDYEKVMTARQRNFRYLHQRLGGMNLLRLKEESTYMYPMLLENGSDIRGKLQQLKIYIPELWPSVGEAAGEESADAFFAHNILPLPIDQRYGTDEMQIMINEIKKLT